MENYVKKHVLEFLEKINVKFTIHDRYIKYNNPYDDGVTVYDVYIYDDVDLKGHKFETLPISFKEVQGDFLVSGIGLTKLTGSPKSVGGVFDCSNNKLTSIAYGPRMVNGDFNCSKNRIKNLTAPIGLQVKGDFNCSNNKISKIKRLPEKIGGDIIISNNLLSKAENFPNNYSGRIDISNNKLIKCYQGIPNDSTIVF